MFFFQFASWIMQLWLNKEKSIIRYRTGLSIYLLCLYVCLLVSNKLENGWTDRAQIFWGTLRDHREGIWMFKPSKTSFQQNSIFIKFQKTTKFFFKKSAIFCFSFPMFTKRKCSQLKYNFKFVKILKLKVQNMDNNPI